MPFLVRHRPRAVVVFFLQMPETAELETTNLPMVAKRSGVRSVRSAPATMMNRPANISSSDQSISA
jgi:hypothetical protein